MVKYLAVHNGYCHISILIDCVDCIGDISRDSQVCQACQEQKARKEKGPLLTVFQDVQVTRRFEDLQSFQSLSSL